MVLPVIATLLIGYRYATAQFRTKLPDRIQETVKQKARKEVIERVPKGRYGGAAEESGPTRLGWSQGGVVGLSTAIAAQQVRVLCRA